MKYSPGKIKELCDLLIAGSSVARACSIVEISRETYYQWLKTKPDLADNIKRAQDQCTQRNIMIIQKAAKNGTWTAAAWWLERNHPEEFSLKTRTELTGKGGGPIQTAAVPLDTSKDDTNTVRTAYETLKSELGRP